MQAGASFTDVIGAEQLRKEHITEDVLRSFRPFARLQLVAAYSVYTGEPSRNEAGRYDEMLFEADGDSDVADD